jgi:tRNA (guanine-N7-)-methyltransferase
MGGEGITMRTTCPLRNQARDALFPKRNPCQVANPLGFAVSSGVHRKIEYNAADLLYALPSIIERLDLGKLFPTDQPLEVELGSGDSSFLVEYARRQPGHNFLGVERLLGRIRKLDRKGRSAGLANLRGVRIESSYFLEYLLPPHSATALHVYFPDPWPKRKHLRNRFINERFPSLASQALVPGGAVYLRTDDQNYFEQMGSVFGASPLFRPVETPADLCGLLTDFERGFLARGIATLRAAYRAVG